ncbi:MAG: FAD binding domain-containing protein [Candidatus Dormibacteraeota bacterium]|nr:FAD binding domain-containing protein [Candidatus Dormibacteraeota bacterium]
MKPAPFEYLRAGSVEEAVSALAESRGEAKVLAGGQSLVPLLALRLARPSLVVDVNRVPGLDGIEARDGEVRFGALVRHARLASQTVHPLLARAAGLIGHPAIRARGTIAGSLAHADPSAELPVCATALGMTLEVTSPSGTREVGAETLFQGALTTSLGESDLVTAVRAPLPERWGLAEFARRPGDFALVLVCVARLASGWRVAAGGVGGVPVRCLHAEAILDAGEADETRRSKACDAARSEVEPVDDLHGSARYRRALVGELLESALAQAGQSAEGGAG